MKKTFANLFILFSLFAVQQLHAKPDTVNIGAYVMSLHDINFHDKEYTARFWLWFTHSNPKFNFLNQIDIPNAKSVETPEKIVSDKGKVRWELMKMKCTMKQPWSVEDFPFDRQLLNIQIENVLWEKNDLIFKPDTKGSKLDKTMAVEGWIVDKFVVSNGVHNYPTSFGDPEAKVDNSDYATFNIAIELKRNAWGLFFKLFIGMYIAFFISLVTFLLDPADIEPRFGLPVGALFAAVGNKYIIDSILPETTSFTLVDTLHAITFSCIFFTILTCAISLLLVERNKKNYAIKVNKIGGYAVISLFGISNLMFITFAILRG